MCGEAIVGARGLTVSRTAGSGYDLRLMEGPLPGLGALLSSRCGYSGSCKRQRHGDSQVIISQADCRDHDLDSNYLSSRCVWSYSYSSCFALTVAGIDMDHVIPFISDREHFREIDDVIDDKLSLEYTLRRHKRYRHYRYRGTNWDVLKPNLPSTIEPSYSYALRHGPLSTRGRRTTSIR